MSNPRILSSSSPLAVNMITWQSVALFDLFIWRQTSNPEVLGNIQSNKTKSTLFSWNNNNPSSPSSARSTLYPSAVRLKDKSSICDGSSSTIKTNPLLEVVRGIVFFHFIKIDIWT